MSEFSLREREMNVNCRIYPQKPEHLSKIMHMNNLLALWSAEYDDDDTLLTNTVDSALTLPPTGT